MKVGNIGLFVAPSKLWCCCSCSLLLSPTRLRKQSWHVQTRVTAEWCPQICMSAVGIIPTVVSGRRLVQTGVAAAATNDSSVAMQICTLQLPVAQYVAVLCNIAHSNKLRPNYQKQHIVQTVVTRPAASAKRYAFTSECHKLNSYCTAGGSNW